MDVWLIRLSPWERNEVDEPKRSSTSNLVISAEPMLPLLKSVPEISLKLELQPACQKMRRNDWWWKCPGIWTSLRDLL